MKARTSPLPPTAEARLWRVDLGPAGIFPFRFPSWAVAHRVRQFVATKRAAASAEPDTLAFPIEMAPTLAVAVGACWWGEQQLATPWPSLPLDPAKLTDDQLLAYGVAVADELQEAGWPVMILARVAAACMNECGARLDVQRMAADLAGFTPPQADSGTAS